MAIVEVVKYNGSPDVFAWKFPSEELGTWTQLIVNESQEAILFKGGEALDVFGRGRYTLETPNIPILNNIINLPFGGKSPFTAEVWYVNKVNSLDIKWGTPSPIQLQDPKYQIFVPVRSFGQFGIQIDDSRKFLIKLVGTLSVLDKDSIVKFFRGVYLTKVKDAISSYLIHKKISILEINAYLEELSDSLKEKIQPVLEEYGIKLVNFLVNDISVPEEDETVKQLKAALAKKAEMDIVGYNYVQQRSFDTLEGAATNQAAAQPGLMGAGIGLGLGAGIGGAMGSQFAGLAQNINTSYETINCPSCGNVMEKGKRFCGSCGYDTQKVKEDESKKCPNCNAAIENSNSKFCPECGVPLLRKCPGCNCDIAGNSKFCPECGTKL
ncbi:SPFH domain-containing protein [Aminipila terrae]|uniref:Zinc-ribbon domain-containing protein n=1 Tax=Aminipila terrae TaxID=2697030 RepID=A0A6P1ML31_9FIRM|nr:SPFH domain-containing protein [Aminipila terrae]QHI72356.1 zinc-ribbon domain-containing protein [Aminipila terrae]